MLALFGGMLAGYAERYEAEEAVYSRTIFTENATASGGAYLDGYQGVSVSWTVEHDGGEVGLSFGIKIPYGTVRSMGRYCYLCSGALGRGVPMTQFPIIHKTQWCASSNPTPRNI